jgi:hypothetical protein
MKDKQSRDIIPEMESLAALIAIGDKMERLISLLEGINVNIRKIREKLS